MVVLRRIPQVRAALFGADLGPNLLAPWRAARGSRVPGAPSKISWLELVLVDLREKNPAQARPVWTEHPLFYYDLTAGACSPASSKQLTNMSTTSRPISSEAVAAGEGTLQTWIMRWLCRKRKSSTRLPFLSTACARTPEPPGTRSASVNSGTIRCKARVKAGFTQARYCSSSPLRQNLRAIFQNPP